MEDNQSKDLILLKIFILGGGGGDGKTCILRRYVENTFSEFSSATIGADFLTKFIKYDKYNLKLQIWDTAGQLKFRSFYPNYYKSADGCIFVFDITNHRSFNEIITVINELNEEFDFEKPKIICANKCDLEKGREIKKEEIEKEIENNCRYNIEVFKTSAKTGQNIDEAFNRLVELIMNKRGENELEKKREENKLIKKKREEKFLRI